MHYAHTNNLVLIMPLKFLTDFCHSTVIGSHAIFSTQCNTLLDHPDNWILNKLYTSYLGNYVTHRYKIYIDEL